MEENDSHYTTHSVLTLFVVFIMDEPIESFSPVQGVIESIMVNHPLQILND